MDADAFAAFEEAGDAFDPDVAARLERFILSAGGSQDAEALYLQFRGKMPGVERAVEGARAFGSGVGGSAPAAFGDSPGIFENRRKGRANFSQFLQALGQRRFDGGIPN